MLDLVDEEYIRFMHFDLNQLIREGKFPPPRWITVEERLWSSEELKAWDASLPVSHKPEKDNGRTEMMNFRNELEIREGSKRRSARRR